MRCDVIVIGDGPVAASVAEECVRLGLEAIVALPRPAASASPGLPPRYRQAVVSSSDFAARLAPPDDAASATKGLRAVHESAQDYLRVGREALERPGIVVLRGPTRLERAGGVRVGTDVHEARLGVVVAPGTRPRRPRRFAFDDVVVCDAETVFRPTGAIRQVAVVGAHEEGCEIACALARLGAAVTLIDRRRTLLRSVDRDLLEALHRELRASGVEIVLGETIEEVDVHAEAAQPHAVLALASGRVERCDRLTVCAGRVPNVEGLGLRAAGVDTDRTGFVIVDEFCRTSRAGVYAVADVTGIPSELGVGLYQARLVTRGLAGHGPRPDEHVPGVTYTIPEMAAVGLTEEACQRLGYPAVAGTSRYDGAASARAGGAGLLKVVAGRPGGEIVGVHAIGPHARELIHVGADLLRARATVDAVLDRIFLSPSLSEAFAGAAREAWSELGAGGGAPLPETPPSETPPSDRF